MSADRLHVQCLILACGFALSSATQLRFAGPVGPGECLLVVWAVVALWTHRDRLRLPEEHRLYAGFLIGSAVLLLLGALIADSVQQPVRNGARDSVALLFSAGLLAVVLMTSERRRLELVARYLVFVAAGSIAIVYIAGVLGVGGTLLDVWWPSQGRFQGWAGNPNQLALQFGVLPFLALALMKGGGTTRGLSAAGMVAVWLALATVSKALVICWGAGLLALLLVVRFRAREGLAESYGRSGRRLLVFMVIATLAVGSLIWPRQIMLRYLFAGTLGISEATMKPHELHRSRQLRNRALLALNGVRATVASPLAGWGPGAHSGLSRPHRGRYAHVTLIDWATATGLPGLVGLGLLLGWVVRRLWIHQPQWLPPLTVLIIFSLFHTLLRQPLWWLLPALMAETTILSKENRISQSGHSEDHQQS